MNKGLFYFLSFTWGLPLTLIGCIISLVLLITGHKPYKHGWSWYFQVGQYWGGLELGVCFLTDHTPNEHTKNHEFGHGLQNCMFGPLMIFIVGIPSAARYWIREFKKWRGIPLPPYDSIWFENDATVRGTNMMEKIKNEENNYGNN